MNKLELMKTANEIRKGIVTALHSAKAGHPGGSLSATEIFTYLYFEEMIAIVSFFLKDTQLRDYILHLRRKDSSRRKIS